MKKLLLALSLAFILFSCDNNDMEKEQPIDNSGSPLIGTWEGQTSGGGGGINGGEHHSKLTFTATDYTWELTISQNPTNTNTGTWTYDDTQFTLYNGSTTEKISFSYQIENDVLIFTALFYGTFYHNKID
jgi:hypothetical protein